MKNLVGLVLVSVFSIVLIGGCGSSNTTTIDENIDTETAMENAEETAEIMKNR